MKDKPIGKGLSGNQKVVLAVCCTLAVCAAAVAAVYILNRPTADVFLIPEELPVVHDRSGAQIATAENLQAITARARENVARGMFATYMTSTWSFRDGYSASTNAVKGNSNANRYPFWFTVTEQESGEVVFTSGLIPVGSRLTDITLDVPLPAGDYAAAINVNMVDDEGEIIDGNVALGIRIVVLN